MKILRTVLFLTFLSPLNFGFSDEWVDFKEVSPEIQTGIKLKLEEKLRTTSGLTFACSLTAEACILGYKKMVRFSEADWRDSKEYLVTERKIMISKRSGVNPYGHLNIDASASVASIRKFLGMSSGDLSTEEIKYLQDAKSIDPKDVGPMSVQDITCADKACLALSICPTSPDLKGFYDRIFADGVFKIGVAQGYNDQPGPDDDDYRYAYVKEAKIYYRHQINELKLFGFKIVSQESDKTVMERKFFYNQKEIQAHVEIVDSMSFCPGDDETVETLMRPEGWEACEAQIEASTKALAFFRSSLGSNDFTIYGGHSRHGRGPDFGPRYETFGAFGLLDGGMDNVNFLQNQTVIYFNSCSSTSHFTGLINDLEASLETCKIGYISNSEKDFWIDNPITTNRAILGLMEQKCSADVKALVDASRSSFSDAELNIQGF
jgi:hypothetical protein